MSAPLVALYAVLRGLIYTGLLLLVGIRCSRALVLRTIADDGELQIRERADRLAVALSGVLLLLFLARGAMQVCSLVDPGDAITIDTVRSILIDTSWGHAWLLQVASGALLTVALRWWRSAAITPVAIALVLWGQSGMGHAAADRWPPWIGRILDSAHLLGAGTWLGTLGVLAIFAMPALRHDTRLPALARLVRAYSIYARAGVLLVVISGVVATLVYAQSLSAFVASTWGRLLLIKLASMIGVLVLGWYNWRVVTPALDGAEPQARARLRTAVGVELLLAIIMLGITTMLVVSPLPGEG